MLYPVEFDETGPTVVVWLPDMSGAHDEGGSREEAMARLLGAALAVIQDEMDANADIPNPGPADGRPVLTLPSQAWVKVLLYRAMRERGWRRVDLGRAIGTDPKGVNRLLDVHHASRWDQIDQAFRSLGKVFVPGVQAAHSLSA